MKKNLFKRALSLLLCITMFVSLGVFPSASAAGTNTGAGSSIVTSVSNGVTVTSTTSSDYPWHSVTYSNETRMRSGFSVYNVSNGWDFDYYDCDDDENDYTGNSSTLTYFVKSSTAVTFKFDICMSNLVKTTDTMVVKVNNTVFDYKGNGQRDFIIAQNTASKVVAGLKTYLISLPANTGSETNKVEFIYSVPAGSSSTYRNNRACAFVSNIQVEAVTGDVEPVDTYFNFLNSSGEAESFLSATYQISGSEEVKTLTNGGKISAEPGTEVTVSAEFKNTATATYDPTYKEFDGFWLDGERVTEGVDGMSLTFTVGESEQTYSIKSRGTIFPNPNGSNWNNMSVYGAGGNGDGYVWTLANKTLSASQDSKLTMIASMSDVIHFMYKGDVTLPSGIVSADANDGWKVVSFSAEKNTSENNVKYEFITKGEVTFKEINNYTAGSSTNLGVSCDSSQGSFAVYGAKKIGTQVGNYYLQSLHTAVLVATPNDKYTFAGWYDGDVKLSDSATYVYTAGISSNLDIEARFLAPATIFTSTNYSDWGSVDPYLLKSYKVGSEATVTATPASGCSFVGWYENGELVSSNAAYTFTVTGGRSLKAKFAKEGCQLITLSSDSSMGSISGYSGGVAAAENGSLTLYATPKDGYMFVGWYKNGEWVETASNNNTSFKNSYTFSNLQDGDIIEARFALKCSVTFSFEQSWFSYDHANNVTVSVYNADGKDITKNINSSGDKHNTPNGGVREVPVGGYIVIDTRVGAAGLKESNALKGWYVGGELAEVTSSTYSDIVCKYYPTADCTAQMVLEQFEAVADYTPGDNLTSVETKKPYAWTYTNGVLQGKVTYNGRIAPLKVTAADSGVLLLEYKNGNDDTANTSNYLAYDTAEISSTVASSATKLAKTTEWTSVTIPVSAGQTIYFGFRGDTGSSNYAQIRNMRVVSGVASISADTLNDAGVSGNLGGSVSGNTGTVVLGETVTLTATPNQGYVFVGWRENGHIISEDAVLSFPASADRALTAVFNYPNAYAAKIGMDSYKTLTDALLAANSGDTVVMIKDVTLASNLTIPVGVTLVIPSSASDKGNGTVRGNAGVDQPPIGSNKYAAATLYRTLTINNGATLTVNGKLVVNAEVGGNDITNYQQTIHGGYGRVLMNDTAKIVVNGAMDCFGKVERNAAANDQIIVNSGATLTDLYVVDHWRGGSQAYGMYQYGIYPMNEYHENNIATPITVMSGATYSGFIRMYASSSFETTRFPQVSNTNGLIRLASGASLVKAQTSDGKEKYTITGGATFGGSSLNIAGQNLSTSNYIYPFPGNYQFELTNGGYSFSENFKFLPGVVMNTANAQITVNEGKSVVFYDQFNDICSIGGSDTHYPSDRGAAMLQLTDNSSLMINGAFAGYVASNRDANNIKKGANASLAVTTKEAGNGVVDGGSFAGDHSNYQTLSFNFIPESYLGYTGGWVGDTYKWTRNSATVSFDTDGGTAISPITQVCGTAFELPKDTTKTGYVLDGWTLNGEEFDWDVMPETSCTVKAVWKPAENTAYTVQHYWQNVSDNGYTLHETESLTGTTDSNVSAAAKNYSGLTLNSGAAGTVTSGTVAPDGSLVLKLYYDRSKYSLSWNVNGGSAITSTGHTAGMVKFGTTIVKPANDPTKTGYDFSGWQGYTENMTMPASALALTAQWTAKRYTVTFNANEGTCGVVSKTADYDSTYGELPTPTRTGYTFDGWYNGETEITADSKVEILSDITLTAHWTAKTFTVTLDPNEGTLPTGTSNTVTVTYGQAYGTLPTPTKTGYSFLGWYDGTQKVESTTAYQKTEGTELTAKWGVVAYTITYYVDDQEFVQNYNYGDTITPYVYEKAGYSVSEWALFPSGKLPATMPAKGLVARATLSPITYTITYNLDGGTDAGTNPASYTIETDDITIAAPTKTGYTFKGWKVGTGNDAVAAPVIAKGSTGNVTLTAVWEANKHNVSYVLDGEANGTGEAAYGTTVTVKAAPEKTGYTFSGWATTDAAVTDGAFTMPDKDVTITGSFTPNTYTVKFAAGGGEGTMDAQSFTYDAAQALSDNTFTRTGYTFAGWKLNSDTYSDKQSVQNLAASGEVTLTAQWTVNQYTITFVTDGGTVIAPITQNYGTAITKPANPTKAGYKFVKWDVTVPETMPAGDMTITAVWKSFVEIAMGLTPDKAMTVYPHFTDEQKASDDGKLVIDAIRERVIFVLKDEIWGKVTDANDLLNIKNVGVVAELSLETDSTDVEVQLNIEDYLALNLRTVPFLSTLFGDKESMTVQVGAQNTTGMSQDAIMIAVASEAGISIADATTTTVSALDGKTMKVLLTDTVLGDIEYSVEYTLSFYNKEHNVSWDLNGGTAAAGYTSGKLAYGEDITAPVPTKTGYTFAGWTPAAAETMGKTDLSYTAQWTANTDTAYTVKHMTEKLHGTYELAQTETLTGTTAAEVTPGVKTIEGFTAPSTQTVTIAADGTTEVEYQYTRNSYTVTYKVDDAQVKQQTVKYGAAIPAYSYTKTGYTVSAWAALPETMPASDVTVTAATTAIDYTITYNLDGGTNAEANPESYNIETETITLAAPTKTGYTFGGWYDNSEFTGEAVTAIANGSTEDKTFYAKWDVVTYDVTYNANGGEGAENGTYTVESAEITLPSVTKTGYTFDGWYDNSEFTGEAVTAIAAGNTGNKEFYAKWDVVTYDVTYNANGGEGAENGTYTVESAEITLPSVTKTGYTFGGWYDNSEFTGEAVTAIAAGSTEDKTFYAKWTANTYTVSFKANGGEGTMNAQSFTYDAAQALSDNTFTKTGYTFAGWKLGEVTYTDKASVSNLAVSGNVELVAQWSVNPYTITFNTDGGSEVAAITQDYNTAITKPAAPTKAGYKFTGWDKTVPDTMPAGDMTIKATWKSYLDIATENLDDGYKYIQTVLNAYSFFTADQKTSTEGQAVIEYIKGYEISKLKAEIEEKVPNANALLNINNVGKVAELSLNAENMAVEVKVIKDDYKALDLRSTQFLTTLFGEKDTMSIKVGSQNTTKMIQDAIMFAVAAEAGIDTSEATTATLSALDGKSMKVVFTDTIYDIEYSVECTLSFFNEKHDITWNADGGTLSGTYSAENTAYGTAITAPTAAKTGYTFAGWTPTVAETMGKTDLSYTAQWTANTYSVSFNANGGSTCESINVTYDSTYGELPAPTKTGYTFAGWFNGENEVVSTDTVAITADTELTAAWTANTYSVSFNANGGSECESQSATFDAAFGTLPTPTRAEYDFDGWYLGENEVDSTTTYNTADDVTLTAKWTARVYTVSYEWANDGSSCVATRVCTTDENDIATENASIKSSVAKAATCTVKGSTKYTASFTAAWAESQTKTIQDITEIAHTPEIDPAVPATTFSDGLTEGSHCSVCKAVIVAQQKVDKLEPENENTAEVEVKVEDEENATEVESNIPEATFEQKSGDETKPVTIKAGSFVVISFNNKAAENIAKNADKGSGNSAVALSVAKEKAEDKAEELAEAGVKGATTVLSLELTDSEGENLFTETEGGSADVTVPYTPKNKNATIIVYYMNGSTKTQVPAKYDSETKMLTITVKHFSAYPITEHEFGAPVFTWNDEGTAATAQRFCKDNGCTDCVNCDVSMTSGVKTAATCTTMGWTTYTATVTIGGESYTDTSDVQNLAKTEHNFENGKCTACGADDPDHDPGNDDGGSFFSRILDAIRNIFKKLFGWLPFC